MVRGAKGPMADGISCRRVIVGRVGGARWAGGADMRLDKLVSGAKGRIARCIARRGVIIACVGGAWRAR